MYVARETLWRVLSGKYYLVGANVICKSVRARRRGWAEAKGGMMSLGEGAWNQGNQAVFGVIRGQKAALPLRISLWTL